MTVTIQEPGPWERRTAGFIVRKLLYPRRPTSPHIPPADQLLPRTFFTASDGATLAGIHHPAASSQGIVVLVHPDKRLAKHWWSHRGIVQWLNANGLDAFTFDLSVYGESRGGNVYLHEHVIAAVEEAARLRPDLPLHLWGVSIGSYAAANAAPRLPRLDSLVLESPYPTFRTWYSATGHKVGARVVRLLERLFPTTYARIDAAQNVARLTTPNIIIAATRPDRITPVALSRAVHSAAPTHAHYLEYDDVEHLGLFAKSHYRAALLKAFGTGSSFPAATGPTPSLLTPGVATLSPLAT